MNADLPARNSRSRPHDASRAQSRSQPGEQLARSIRDIRNLPPPPVEGQLTRMVGLTLEALGCQAAVGDRCEVVTGDGAKVDAEVVGFSGDRLFLMPTGDMHGLQAQRTRHSAPG